MVLTGDDSMDDADDEANNSQENQSMENYDGTGDCGIKDEVYIPGRSRPIDETEELVMDKKAYKMFYELKVESASLSFDILLDNLGCDRVVELNGGSVSTFVVAGTQAPQNVSNKVVVMRLSNLFPFKKGTNDTSDDTDSDDSSLEDDLDGQPEVEAATILHDGTVNRIRSKQYKGRYLAASWSENQKVFIWDLNRPLLATNDSAVMSEYIRFNESPSPLFTFEGHRSEGFALDWSSHSNSEGNLASGDCRGHIHYWLPRQSDWSVSKPYTDHTDSVEDIQWSPTEPTVFISVSADRSIRVWDVRAPFKQGSMITVPDAHPQDINVASWSHLQPVNLLTGGDDGSLRIWDLRQIHQRYAGQGKPNSSMPKAYTHVFNYHTKPITSVEWHPTEAGVFVATCEDDQVTFWDINLEQADDTVEDVNTSTTAKSLDDNFSLPVQLLFLHSGQREVKEAHWHPQIPGLVLTTALNGYNVFRTCNI